MRSGRQSWLGGPVRRLQVYGLALAALLVLLSGQGCDQAAPSKEGAISLSQVRLEPHFDARARAALELAGRGAGRSQHALAVPEPVKVVVTVEAADLGQLRQEILPSGGVFATAEIMVTQGVARTFTVVYLDSASAILGFGQVTVDVVGSQQTVNVPITNGIPNLSVGTTTPPLAVVQGTSAAIASNIINGRTTSARIDAAGHRFRLLPALTNMTPLFQDGPVLPVPPFTMAPGQTLSYTANSTVSSTAAPGQYRVDGIIGGLAGVDSFGLRVSINPGTLRVVKSRALSPFATIAAKGLAVGTGSDLFISANNQIFRSISRNTPMLIAGSGAPGFVEGPALTAAFNGPRGMAVSGANVHIADANNDRIRLLAGGTVSTVAGNGAMTPPVDNVAATASSLKTPVDVKLVPGSADYVIADLGNNRVRRVDGVNQMITTIAGNGGTGTSIAATADASVVEKPSALAFDLQNNLLIGAVAFTGSRRGVLLRLNRTTNTLTIVAGSLNSGTPMQDGVLATNSALDEIRGIAADALGNLYISTTAGAAVDGLVRQVTPEGVILTIAGNKTAAPGIGSPATNFGLSTPEQIVPFPPDDELLIALTGETAIKSLR